MRNYAERIRECYDPDATDIAVGSNGEPVLVTWAEKALLEMVEAQQEQIAALQKQIAALQWQVARLIDAVPQAAVAEKAEGC